MFYRYIEICSCLLCIVSSVLIDTGAAGRSSIDHTVEVALYRLEKSEEQGEEGKKYILTY